MKAMMWATNIVAAMFSIAATIFILMDNSQSKENLAIVLGVDIYLLANVSALNK